MARCFFRIAIVLVVLGAMAGGFLWWAQKEAVQPGPSLANTNLVIPRGTGSQEMAHQLREAGLVNYEWLFLLVSRLNGKQPALRAGEYAFPAHVSLNTIIDMMRRGQIVVHKLTVPEGWTVSQIITQIRTAEGLSGKIDSLPEEGSLMPQTYFYSFGDSREAMVGRMSKAMADVLDELWTKRIPSVNLANKKEALILASIIERETALSEERPHIAAVFLNRLKQHMKLQSDPTVIYALNHGEGILDRPLTHDDLAVVSPYNTYVIDGLPPLPICNPSRGSLKAAVTPSDSADLYFVADGNGHHVFAKTLADHNKNIARWRATQKESTSGQDNKPATAEKPKE